MSEPGETSREREAKPETKPAETKIDVQERGAGGQVLDRRLYMQLQVYGGCADPEPLAAALEKAGVEAALYRDINDPRGVGVLGMHEDPAFFVTRFREILAAEPFDALTHRPALTMLGRSYASGFEPDLAEWLLRRPRRTVLNPAWPWAIWYPLAPHGRVCQALAGGAGEDPAGARHHRPRLW